MGENPEDMMEEYVNTEEEEDINTY